MDQQRERRPLILCEYSHAMGNSNGGLSMYWAAFLTHRSMQVRVRVRVRVTVRVEGEGWGWG